MTGQQSDLPTCVRCSEPLPEAAVDDGHGDLLCLSCADARGITESELETIAADRLSWWQDRAGELQREKDELRSENERLRDTIREIGTILEQPRQSWNKASMAAAFTKYQEALK